MSAAPPTHAQTLRTALERCTWALYAGDGRYVQRGAMLATQRANFTRQAAIEVLHQARKAGVPCWMVPA